MKKYLIFGIFCAAQTSFASLILTSPIFVPGTGLGNEPTLLTITSPGSSSVETGCVGSTAALIGDTVNTTGVCQGSGSNVSTGASQIGPQTLAAGGITTASTFGIVFNAAEPGGDGITLTGLTATFYSSTGTFLYQTSGFSCPGVSGCAFPSTNTGTGKSGFLFMLDSAQQTAATTAGAFSSSSNLVGLFASASNATGGQETFYLAAIPPGGGGGGGGGVVPEPGSMLLTAAGIGLAGYLKFRKKATV
jgi:hypothetical protein